MNARRIGEATGERKRFSSAILPPWCRKSPKTSEVLPPALSARPVLRRLCACPRAEFGSSAGLSATTITRFTQQWPADRTTFGERDLSASDYMYVWADGIHLRMRLREARSCVLVRMGVRAYGTKELIALSDGYRESADSWADLLCDCRRRGMLAPVLAVGHGMKCDGHGDLSGRTLDRSQPSHIRRGAFDDGPGTRGQLPSAALPSRSDLHGPKEPL